MLAMQEPDAATPREARYRRHPAHGVYIQKDSPTIVFLTVCTKGRRRWLADAAVHELLQLVWRAADAWLAPAAPVAVPETHSPARRGRCPPGFHPLSGALRSNMAPSPSI